jgi:hypothetical protein
MIKKPAAAPPASAPAPGGEMIHRAVGEDVMVFPAGEAKSHPEDGPGK